MVIRSTEIIFGLASFEESFGAGRKLVKKWQEQGAPIIVVDGTYRAEKFELWEWLKGQQQEAKRQPAK